MLEFFHQSQEYDQAQTVAALTPTLAQSKPCERLFKARFLKLYLGNSHLAYYKFC